MIRPVPLPDLFVVIMFNGDDVRCIWNVDGGVLVAPEQA